MHIKSQYMYMYMYACTCSIKEHAHISCLLNVFLKDRLTKCSRVRSGYAQMGLVYIQVESILASFSFFAIVIISPVAIYFSVVMR